MTFQKFSKRVLLAVATFLAAISPVRAGSSTVSYNPDDLLFGFRQTTGQGSTQDYLLDLGNARYF